MQYDYLINITYRNTFCLYFLTFWLTFYPVVHFQLPTVKLLEMPAQYANISMEMLFLFIDSSIDNVLR